jgi:hypothetical protein
MQVVERKLPGPLVAIKEMIPDLDDDPNGPGADRLWTTLGDVPIENEDDVRQTIGKVCGWLEAEGKPRLLAWLKEQLRTKLKTAPRC